LITDYRLSDADTVVIALGSVIGTIKDAVDDGSTVPIYYESRLARLDLNHAEIEALSKQVEDVVEDEEDVQIVRKQKVNGAAWKNW